MRALSSKPNVSPPDTPYPFGRIQDDTGAGDGTPVDEEVYGDIHQFFETLMNYAAVVANGQPENNISGFQLMDALQLAISKRITTRQSDALNDEVYAGIFTVNAVGLVNGPSGFTQSGQLIVSVAGDTIRQTLEEITTGFKWERFYNGTAWGSWNLFRMGIKIVEIGDWNMDTTVTKDVDTGIPHTKVQAITVLIKSDANGFLQPLDYPDTTTQLPGGRVGNIFGTEVTLRRFDGGPFDLSTFSSTGYNRGFIQVTYAP